MGDPRLRRRGSRDSRLVVALGLWLPGIFLHIGVNYTYLHSIYTDYLLYIYLSTLKLQLHNA